MEHSIYIPPRPITLTITFENRHEAEDLYVELSAWTPTNGWGPLAQQFFTMLKECKEKNAK